MPTGPLSDNATDARNSRPRNVRYPARDGGVFIALN